MFACTLFGMDRQVYYRRIKRRIIKQDKAISSKRNYFYGVKVQLITTKDGIPIAFHFTPGKTGDAKALGKMIDKLPVEASLYGVVLMDYGLEDIALEKKGI